MNNSTGIRLHTCILLLLGLVAFAPAAAAEQLIGEAVAYPVASPVGATHGILAAAWQQWAGSMPASAHPLFDTADCSEGQFGPIWFLGGKFCPYGENCPAPEAGEPNRSCTVPQGTALFFPVVNFSCLNAEAAKGFCGNSTVPADMRAFIGDVIGTTTDLQVLVDGKPIKGDLKNEYRVQSPVYPVTLPKNNLLYAIGEKIQAGSYWGVDDGIYVLLQPLSVGKHTLQFKGTFPEYGFTLDFTYDLTVQ